MKDKKPLPEIHPRTLGDLSFIYKMQVRTFMTLIAANEDLEKEIIRYTENVKRKAAKILPPNIINKIIMMIGEP